MDKANEFKTGWLSPSGEFFQCSCFDHVPTANRIVEQYGYPAINTDGEILHSDDILLAHGWVHISISDFLFGHEWRVNWGWNRFLTDSQKAVLCPYFDLLRINDMDRTRWESELDRGY